MLYQWRDLVPTIERRLTPIQGIHPENIHAAWYEGDRVYFTHFTEDEIRGYFDRAGFRADLPETRKPCDFEIAVDRIYAIGKKKR